MATTKLVSIEEYLATSYNPDVEYVDGVLKSRHDESKAGDVVTKVHGRLQSLISNWFVSHEDRWPGEVAVEVRTLISPSRVRLPDVVVYRPGNAEQTLVEPPLIMIEILSPGDTYVDTQRMATDYQNMGVENIWIIDPETRTGRTCQGKDWIGVKRFEVAGTEIYLDLEELFARLDRSRKVQS